MAIFSANDASVGAVCGRGGLLPVAITVTDTTIARETSQPNMNAAPFLTPRLDGSTMKNADNGSGSRVMASPMSIRSKTTAGDLNRGTPLGRDIVGPLTVAPGPGAVFSEVQY